MVKWLEQFPTQGWVSSLEHQGAWHSTFGAQDIGWHLAAGEGTSGALAGAGSSGPQMLEEFSRFLHLSLPVVPPTLPPAGSKTPSIPSLTLFQPLSFLKQRDFLLPLSWGNLTGKAHGTCDPCCILPGHCEDVPCSARAMLHTTGLGRLLQSHIPANPSISSTAGTGKGHFRSALLLLSIFTGVKTHKSILSKSQLQEDTKAQSSPAAPIPMQNITFHSR